MSLLEISLGVAEWLARGSGELGDPSSPAATDFSVKAEWSKNTHMLPLTLPRAGVLHRRA